VALVVLDPLMSTIGADIDTHKERDTRVALDPLARMADKTRCIMLGIAHFNKGSGNDASSLITGSGAFKNVARTVFGFARDPDDGTSVLTQTKNSLGRSDLPSLLYTIEEAIISTPTGETSVGRFVFCGESERSVGDILGGAIGDDESERQDAAKWLRAYLEDNGGEAEAVDIFKAGDKVGFSKDALKRSKKRAGVISRKEAMDAGWMWVIDLAPKGAKSAKSAKGGESGETRSLLLPSHDPQAADGTKGAQGSTLPRTLHASLPSLPSLPSTELNHADGHQYSFPPRT
jgi:hypothetical protein